MIKATMTHQKWYLPKKPYLRVLLIGSACALLPLIISLPFLGVGQCPDGYTQQQIDVSDCIVGANIGAALAAMASIAIEAVVLLTTLILFIVQWQRNH
jgi:hypothetical protein